MKKLLPPRSWQIILLLVLAFFIPYSALAQGSDPTDDDVNAIARQLYCPVCENIPLDTCGTAACEQWRGIIREKLSEGWTEEEIKTYFVNQYGDRVLAEPPRQGFNWLVYLVPGLIFIAGGVLLYQGFRKWQVAEPVDKKRKKAKQAAKVDDIDPEYLSRIEEELKKRSGK